MAGQTIATDRESSVATGVTSDALADRITKLEQRLSQLEERISSDRLTLVVFSGELDRLLASFVIANGAAACGMQVTMFFTFWGAASLKKNGRQGRGKTAVERMFGWMLRGGVRRCKLSRLDMLGLGRRIMRREMARKNVADLPELIETAADLGVQIRVCEMSLSLMGIRREELIDYPHMEFCGVAGMLDHAGDSNATLFI